jgi:outer membrane protein assembly factor BamB
MTTGATEVSTAADVKRRAPVQPRLWPAQFLVAAYWITWLIMKVFFSATMMQFLVMFNAPMVLAAGVLVWWLFFSRLPWVDRLWGIGCVILGGLGAWLLIHGSMGMVLIMNALPVAITAVVGWMIVSRGATTPAGRAGLLVASVLAWGYFTLIRFDGVTGDMVAERSWRWSETSEDRYLKEIKSARGKPESASDTQSTASDAGTLQRTLPTVTAADWPEFRGAARDAHLRGVNLAADWTAQPPREVWRRRIGPGWGSFAVVGDLVFTQEQRGENEAVICIDLTNGQDVWLHEDKARFTEIVAGAGPRATPTFHDGKLYTLGGSGRLNCLDAATGKVIWSRDVATDADTKPPGWGFSSSPLVVDGTVIVFAGHNYGERPPADQVDVKKKAVLGYDAQSGEPRWKGGKGSHSYSSPQLLTTGDSRQVLMVSDYGLEAFEPATGQPLWEHKWFAEGIFRVCQPHVVGDSQVLIGTWMGHGTRLLTISRDGDTWKVTEGWTSKELKPYFNDFVSRDGHVYGYDGEILVCLDLTTGKKKWKKGRYGHGQALLVGDAGQAVLVSDTGEVILMELTPQGPVEHGKFQAIKGKTWNHPVIAGGKLLVRNGEEMACFALGSVGESLAAQR